MFHFWFTGSSSIGFVISLILVSGGEPLYPNLNFDKEGFLLVYIDGSCARNGKSDAQAGFGVWFNYNNALNHFAPVKGIATNNRAEIQAATKAIQQANSIGIQKIKVHTDSMFLINCMTQWIQKWKENDWKTVKGNRTVKNKDSLLELESAVSLMEKVEWEYVEAHSNITGNKEADALAKEGAALYKS